MEAQQIQKIVEKTRKRLAEMPARQPPALLFPKNPNERKRENERRLAVWADRERVAAEVIAAMKAEIPAHWPKWDSAGWDSVEREFEAFAAWCDRMAELDR